MKKIKIVLYFILFLSLLLFFGIVAQGVYNKLYIQNVDKLKIVKIEEQMRQLYQIHQKEPSVLQRTIDALLKQNQNNILSDVAILRNDHVAGKNDVLVVFYWKNPYKDIVFFIALFDSGKIAIYQCKDKIDVLDVK